ncbi:MAG: AmmeMemoRadiSam system protein B [Anaerolineae bacterium]|nr:AmmeMemoRadiSam system protein B [Anaerolineae bacterium]
MNPVESKHFFRSLMLSVVVLLFLGCTILPNTPTTAGQPADISAATTPTPSLMLAEATTPAKTLSPPPVPVGEIRPSAIAGSWYPDDPDQLAQMIDGFLAAVEPVAGEPVGLVVPHAGYVYSGLVAARAFKQLAGKPYNVAVIIAADHQLPLSDPISVWAEGGFATPLGVVPVDAALAEALLESDPRIVFDPDAHQGEHPLEIELPFLQRVCPQCAIVPVLMGTDDDAAVQALANALISALRHNQKRVVLIASSDLSHYPQQQDARQIDSATLAAIETGNPVTVRQTIAASMAAGVPNLATCACGEGAILAVMQAANGLGADTVTILDYATSADSPYGEANQVVGYGAVMFWDYEPLHLTEKQQKELLNLARTAITEYLETGQVPNLETEDPELTRRSGAFVTLKQKGELRGCIGHMRADTPLAQVVPKMAVTAATNDPRFPPMTLAELADVSLEISVLSPMHRITDIEQIEVGKHGLMIIHNGRQGVLLPQVPIEQGWERQEFLENLCAKAGLPGDCWTEQPTLYTFTALVFGE